jgi:hypothetical protein
MVVCDVKVFPLKVERHEERWPEKGERQLKWLSRTKAARTVEDSGLGTLIRSLPKLQ